LKEHGVSYFYALRCFFKDGDAGYVGCWLWRTSPGERRDEHAPNDIWVNYCGNRVG